MEVKRNPKDSMKSTWRRSPRSEWTIYHRLIERLDIHHAYLDKPVPVHSKDDPVPYLPEWQVHRWILIHAAVPLAIHQAVVHFTGRNLSVIGAFALYHVFFSLNGIREMRLLRHLGHTYGFLDGDKHERDGVPDVGVKKVFMSIFSASNIRPMLVVMLAYRKSQLPSSMSWAWLPVEIALYGLAVDFWFYWYHRLMHDVGSLWQFHRTHHLTKHPNPLLSLYADGVQEMFDTIVIPLLAFYTMRKGFGLPMGFYELWICHQYLLFTEVMGHSGLRIYATAPTPLSWLYRWLGVEGIIEDHDLHHRNGWKSSFNYGKHSRIWDTIFGTTTDRVECQAGNIDHVNTASIPMW
ncbi:Fatty acid hydroxylase [Metarhizium album ARSEF 1941]|uniref:Fatty acid hydroxylase n=1 Tax=Metarhizium album (strain ARSEF 1941) TaxID=1081103 RepID=A0A0B2X069_METAS|nr:Fatty acid hydroxylase [Metarhizium album ARSEF 1941]KHN99688.1 Fatty acid hydroxylase [Metarhizium album ARSEF 1941]